MPAPPIPSPEGRSCPNCGYGVPERAAFCPHCGANLPTYQGGTSLQVYVVNIARGCGVLILGTIAFFFGANGACAMLFAFGSNDFSGGLGGFIAGAVFVGIAGLCVQGMKRLRK